MVDAVLHVRVNQLFRQRLDSTTRRNQLHEDFSAIAILDQHLVDGAELSGNFSQAQPKRFLFRLGMFVFFSFSTQINDDDGVESKSRQRD